ncbi:MAG: porin, partial [Gemmataceae bacterium]|nr:porin [Gemmataceae bacterium]
FPALLLTAAVSAGQPPASHPPGVVVPAGQPPAALPKEAPPAPTPPAAPNGTSGNGTNGNNGPPGNPATIEQIKTEKEETPPERTKYLLERSLAETRLGKLFENRGILVYGWTQMSYTPSTASGTNLPMTLNDRANEFLMNQNYLIAEKTIDTSKKEFQLGWAMNWILPGSDARYTIIRGLWDDQLRKNNGGPELYPIDPYQFYVQAWLPNLGPNGTKVIVGRFATHMSYEVIQAVDAPFVSRSYGFQYNPFTHTGVWATTQLNDDWSVGNGLATGNDTFIDPANRLTYLGRLMWAPKEGKTQVILNTSVTNPTYDASQAFPFYNDYNLQVIHKFTDKLTYVLDATYSHISDAPLPNGTTGYADWYGAVNYLIYSHTDTVASTLRAEVFNDTTGFRTGYEGLYTEVTYGVAWKPCPGLLIRPSVRYDYNGYSRPFEGSHDLWTGTLEAIVRW